MRLVIVLFALFCCLYAQTKQAPPDCPIGTFITANATKEFICEDCPAGFFSAKKGSYSCESCVPGTFAPTQKSSSCKQCEKGYYSPFHGASACLPCALHFTGSSQGLKQCTECPPESFTKAVGSVSCSVCPAGTEHSNSKRGTCVPCPLGYHNDKEGSRCKKCQAGYSTPKVGSVSCILCKPGTYESNGQCIKCDAHSYTHTFGAQKCLSCPSGFSASTDRTTCVDVPQVEETEVTVSSSSWSFTVVKLLVFLLVSSYGLSALDEYLMDNATHMKLILLFTLVFIGKALGDNDGWLLAYTAVFRFGEVPSWYGLSVNAAIVRLVAGVAVFLLYCNYTILIVEAAWFSLCYFSFLQGLKKQNIKDASIQHH